MNGRFFPLPSGLFILNLLALNLIYNPAFSFWSEQEKGMLVMVVPAQLAWTDTGLEVEEGEELIFRASGTISLQTGNPEGFCGPEGIDLLTEQQPLPGERFGLLIGKVARLLSTEVDPETKEVVRHEEIRLFPIGAERTVTMPLSGRLYLGINENVVEDNSGEFLVIIRKKSFPARAYSGETSCWRNLSRY